MTPEQLQAIRARLDAATPGNWKRFGVVVSTDLDLPQPLVVEACSEDRTQAENDVEFIAHAPTDLRALLDEVERLKAREESLVQQSVAQIGMIGRLQEEVERLKAENIKQFRQGAELMQSAILYILHDYNIDPQAIADIVQMDYPIRPEDWAKRPRSET